jgi:small-conductance mechanosensitive channel
MIDLDSIVLLKLGRNAVTVGGLVEAAIIIAVAVIAARVAQSGLRRLRDRHVRKSGSIYIAEKLITYGLVVVGVMAGLSSLGLNLSSLAVFAGALGVGVGLGLQGVVKEFVSGLVLIFDGVVNIGDYIEVEGGTRGLVHEIGPRATRVRNNDNVDVLVPNSRLIENPVTNWTLKGDTRRIHIPFGVAYGSDKDEVRKAVLQAARDVPFTLPETESRKSQVWLVGFGDSALNFELVVWPTLEAAKRPASMHAAYTWAIDNALRAANIEIPFPQRDVRLRGLFGQEGQDALRVL